MPGSRSLGLALPCTDSWCDSTRGSSLTGHRCGLKEEVSGVAKGHPPLRSVSGGHLRSVSCSFECHGPRSTHVLSIHLWRTPEVIILFL